METALPEFSAKAFPENDPSIYQLFYKTLYILMLPIGVHCFIKQWIFTPAEWPRPFSS